MEISLAVQPQEGASRIQSRDGGGGVGSGRTASRARPTRRRRALGGLLKGKQPAAEDAPARPHWRSSLKKAVACICKPACSGGHDDDVADQRRRRRKQRRRRRRRGICSGFRSPPGEPEDYWTLALRGSSLSNEALMHRFAVEEDAMRQRMEVRLAARNGRAWSPPGPSRLSQMSLSVDGEGEISSTSP